MIKIEELCTGCQACISVCPMHALSIKEGKAVVSTDCITCELCIFACPIRVITVLKEEKVVKRVDKLEKKELNHDVRSTNTGV